MHLVQEVARVTWSPADGRSSTSRTDELPSTPPVWTAMDLTALKLATRLKRGGRFSLNVLLATQFRYPDNHGYWRLPHGPEAVHSVMKEAPRASVLPRHWTSREVGDCRVFPRYRNDGFEEVKVGSERRTCSCSSRMQRRYCHWPQGRKGNGRFLYGCHECVRALRTKYKEWQLTRSLNKALAPVWAYFVRTDHQGLQRKGHLLWGRH